MSNKLLIRDLTLRDGQQSQLATRMNQEQINRILPYYREANFYALEVWGGAVPDSTMRFLNENPWERLSIIKESIGDVSKLTALSRGRNLFGYNPYPDQIIEGFNRNAVKTGIDIMRIFDALNDLDNMKSTIAAVKGAGGLVDCAVCYTVDPRLTIFDKIKAVATNKRIPPKIFTIDYFLNKALELESFGADIITIKDMAGLIDPLTSGRLVKALKKSINKPIDLHTHCTPGYGLASILMGMINGADIVDTVILSLSGGPAAPAIELIELFARKLGLETDLNYEAIYKIDQELRKIREELRLFDKTKKVAREFNVVKDRLPSKIEKCFDDAIEFGQKNKINMLLKACHSIEEYFNLPAPNIAVKDAEVPGGMYTNMIAQLENMNLPQLFSKVLKTIPIVRLDAGLTPLVTPTSQIVGAQAVNSVINKAKGLPFYKQTSTQFKNLIKGSYGKTPFPISKTFRKKIVGHREEQAYDLSQYKKPQNPIIIQSENIRIAQDEKEELLLELFPDVATKFLKEQKLDQYREQLIRKKNREFAEMSEGLSGNYQDDLYIEDDE